MDERHKIFYKKNVSLLTKNLRINELMGSLLAKDLITDRDYQKLECLSGNDGSIVAAEHLFMNVLLRKPDIQSMYTFVDVLYQNDHKPLMSFFLKDFPELQAKYAAGENNPPAAFSAEQYVISAGAQTISVNDPPSAAQTTSVNDPPSAAQTTGVNDPPSAAQTTEAGDTGGKKNSRSTAVDRFKKESVRGTQGRGYDFGNDNGQIHKTWNKKTTDNHDDIKSEKLKKYICQIIYKQGSATGFVYDYDEDKPLCYIMTSQHIESQLKKDKNAYVIFNKQAGGPAAPSQCKIKNNSDRKSNQKLDFMLLELELEENYELYKYFKRQKALKNYIPDEDIKDVECMRLHGHPLGQDLQSDVISVIKCEEVIQEIIQKQNNEFLDCAKGYYLEHLQRTDTDSYGRLVADSYIFYSSSSLHGSSGSPCFQYGPGEDDIRLICMQKGGLYACNNDPKDGEQCDFAMGVKLVHIEQYLKQKQEQPMDTGE